MWSVARSLDQQCLISDCKVLGLTVDKETVALWEHSTEYWQ